MSDDFTTFTRMPEAGNIAAVFPDDDHAKPRGDGFTARSPALPDVLVDFAELVASETPSRELHRDDHHPAAAREHFNAQCPAGRVAGLDSVAA
jgi:hypothetical protein